jgi:hypothetical protein
MASAAGVYTCLSLAYRQLPEVDRLYSDQTEDRTWKYQAEPHQFLLEFDHNTGWISCRSAREGALLRLCWLPPNRRGNIFARNDSHVVVGASQGAVTIMDFCNVLGIFSRTRTV